MKMLTGNLAAGDTYSAGCDSFAPGFEGYAIARASFRHAHGVAYVLGNFAGGASRDLAHGYLALVIPDPEFGEAGGRLPPAKLWGSNQPFVLSSRVATPVATLFFCGLPDGRRKG